MVLSVCLCCAVLCCIFLQREVEPDRGGEVGGERKKKKYIHTYIQTWIDRWMDEWGIMGARCYGGMNGG